MSEQMKYVHVPVAITDDMAIAFHAATTDSALGRDDMEEIKAGLQAVQELFTAQQKHVPVGWEVCSPEWCNKHNACHEAPRIWYESEDGTGQHHHPSEYPTPHHITN